MSASRGRRAAAGSASRGLDHQQAAEDRPLRAGRAQHADHRHAGHDDQVFGHADAAVEHLEAERGQDADRERRRGCEPAMPSAIFGRDGSSGSTAGLSRRVLAWLFWPSRLTTLSRCDDRVVGRAARRRRRAGRRRSGRGRSAAPAAASSARRPSPAARPTFCELPRLLDRRAAGDAARLGGELLLQLADLRLELDALRMVLADDGADLGELGLGASRSATSAPGRRRCCSTSGENSPPVLRCRVCGVDALGLRRWRAATISAL